MSEMKKAAIISLGNIDLEIHSRVLRQIKTLQESFETIVIAYGHESKIYKNPGTCLYTVGSLSDPRLARAASTAFFLTMGRINSRWGYEKWYWNRPGHREAYRILESFDVDYILANNWWSLPVAVRYQQKKGGKIILDLHEYALDEFADHTLAKFLYQPMIEYQFRRYLKKANAFVVVNQSVAQRYADEFGITSQVVMNAPDVDEAISVKPTDPDEIHLVHHGYASRDRELETMIILLGLLNARYQLTLILSGDDRYIIALKRFAEKVAPGRVKFAPFVPPESLQELLNTFDMGIYILPAKNYNFQIALPNKFFEFISACLPVCSGPSSEMAKLIRQYHCGMVAESFEPQAFATLLNELTVEQIDCMKHSAMLARNVLNARNEQKKLLETITAL